MQTKGGASQRLREMPPILASSRETPQIGDDIGRLERRGSDLSVWASITNYCRLQGGTSGKGPACQCRRYRRLKFEPWVGKMPERGNGNPLHYSYLEKPMDSRTWQATVHRVAQNWTWLRWLSMHMHGSHRVKHDRSDLVCTYMGGLSNKCYFSQFWKLKV